ncbi:hypothetical protein [Streptomyces sp. NPDC097981]|uniref:hypothetical protein n=1 Tax=Streptomyces sp. NPDC097981 TaxID=3155428 RepID=UPI00332C2C0B
MIKNLLQHGLPAPALTALPLLISTAPAAHAVPAAPGAVAVIGRGGLPRGTVRRPGGGVHVLPTYGFSQAA